MKRECKILAVDDSQDNLDILAEIFADDYQFETATSGPLALELAVDFLPDIVLLDVMMPQMDGYEVCRRLRRNPILKFTKILMVSAKGLTEERLSGYKAGADDYIVKPFNEEEILRKVQVFQRLRTVEETNHIKSTVLSIVTSKLHGPIFSLAKTAELLRAPGNLRDNHRRRFGEVIYCKAKSLQETFLQVQMLSDMKMGQWRPRATDFTLAELVYEGATDSAVKAAEKDINVTVSVESTPQMHLDYERLITVVGAILDNAIRNAEEGSTIELFCGQDGMDAYITVRDSGRYIPAESQAPLFDPFPEAGDNKGGDRLQLGMALAKETVSYLGGRIEVESVPDAGTTFRVYLPTREHVAKQPETEDSQRTESADLSPA